MDPFRADCSNCSTAICLADGKRWIHSQHRNCYQELASRYPPAYVEDIILRGIDCPRCGKFVAAGNRPEDGYIQEGPSAAALRPRTTSEQQVYRPYVDRPARYSMDKSITIGTENHYRPSGSELEAVASDLGMSTMNSPFRDHFRPSGSDVPMTSPYDVQGAAAYQNFSRAPFNNKSALTIGSAMSRQNSRRGLSSSPAYPPAHFGGSGYVDETAPGPSFIGQPSDGSNMEYAIRMGNTTTVQPSMTYRDFAPTSDTASTGSRHMGHNRKNGSFSSGPDASTPISDAGPLTSEVKWFSPGLNPTSTPNLSSIPFNQMSIGAFNSNNDANKPDAYQLLSSYATATDVDMQQAPPTSPVYPPPHPSKPDKKFKCDVTGCTHPRAFSTRNDLDRHKMSVHRIAAEGQKVYICQGQSCLQAGKTREWPRKDNFKNHCKTSHPDEDADGLVKRSELITVLPANVKSAADPGTDDGEYETETDSDIHNGHKLTIEIPGHKHFRSPSIDVTPAAPPCTGIEVTPKQQDPSHLSPIQTPSPCGSGSHRRPLQPSSQSGWPTWSQTPASRQMPLSVESPEAMLRSKSHPAPHGKDPQKAFGPLLPALSKKAIDQELESKNVRPETRHYIGSILGKRSSFEAGLNRVVNAKTKCQYCDKVFPRPCDTRKHEERHKRRWGCTNTDCKKRFGSKNDWKRHENLVHFQEELWACGETDPNSKAPKHRCIFTCTTPQEFEQHLQEAHNIHDGRELERKEDQRRIGQCWAATMWCGFCCNIIKLNQRDLKQWDERFDHIDDHFREGKRIDEWYPPNEDRSKKELLEAAEPKHSTAACEDSDSSSSSSSFSSPSSSDEELDSPTIKSDECDTPIHSATPSRKHSMIEEDDAQQGIVGQRPAKRAAVTNVGTDSWICCNCRGGIMSVALEPGCYMCHHVECKSCRREVVVDKSKRDVVVESMMLT